MDAKFIFANIEVKHRLGVQDGASAGPEPGTPLAGRVLRPMTARAAVHLEKPSAIA
jgi:hypothetical protein